MENLILPRRTGLQEPTSISKKNHLKDASFLQHMAEEKKHHIFFLKKHRNEKKFFGGMLLKNHVKKVEMFAYRTCKNNQGYRDYYTYLLTTYVIERRAQAFYAIYQDLLIKHQHPIGLESIIEDEKKHLQATLQLIQSSNIHSTIIQQCVRHEETLYQSWLTKNKVLPLADCNRSIDANK